MAIEVTTFVCPDRENGAAFVALAAVSDSDLFVPTVTQALGLPEPNMADDPVDHLLAYLEPLDLLLVLDNYEQLLPVLPTDAPSSFEPTADQNAILSILQRAPNVTMLITSRVRLNLPQEWVYVVGGMTLPPVAASSLDGAQSTDIESMLVQCKASSAVALFVRNAEQVYPSFSLTAQNVHAVARICQLLDGMPLGLELAAVWVRVISCQEICAEIEANLTFLMASSPHVPERHRSLHAVFNSSWQRLSPTAQQVLLRLSLFRNPFDRPAAAQVAGASLMTLAELIDHSFVRRVGAGQYQMHELTRQLAAEKLALEPQAYDQTRREHALYFAHYLDESFEKLCVFGAEQILSTINDSFDDNRKRRARPFAQWARAVALGWAMWAAAAIATSAISNERAGSCSFDSLVIVHSSATTSVESKSRVASNESSSRRAISAAECDDMIMIVAAQTESLAPTNYDPLIRSATSRQPAGYPPLQKS